MSFREFLQEMSEDALYVSGCIVYVYLTLGNIFGGPFHGYAEHELLHAFVFAGLLSLGIALNRRR